MRYEVSGIVRDVRIALDMNSTSSPLEGFGDVDSLSLSELIESKIEDAARVVVSKAPHRMLDRGIQFKGSISWSQQVVGIGGGSIVLPEDFMRLVSFKMSDWDRSVTDPVTEEDPIYELQSSPFQGVRGNRHNPVVAIVSRPVGWVLEFYSCSSGAKVYIQSARYVPVPKIKSGEMYIPEMLYRGVVLYAAHLVENVIGSLELSKSLLSSCNEIIQQ